MSDLRLSELRAANIARVPQFRDAKGRLSHPQIPGRPVGSDWALSQWANATCGELGEAANLIKKIERGDFTLDEARAELGDELCDVLTYLDLLAHRAGVDLAEATIRKWNRVSERVGADVRLKGDDDPAAHETIAGLQNALANERGEGPAPAGWTWSHDHWKRKFDHESWGAVERRAHRGWYWEFTRSGVTYADSPEPADGNVDTARAGMDACDEFWSGL